MSKNKEKIFLPPIKVLQDLNTKYPGIMPRNILNQSQQEERFHRTFGADIIITIGQEVKRKRRGS